jgi:hypothetical protein
MKNFLIGTLIFFSLPFIFNGGLLISQKLSPEYKIEETYSNNLFNYCSIQIPVNIYPKNIIKLKQNEKYIGEKYLLYENLNKTTESYLKETDLFELLGDHVSISNKNSFKTSFFKNRKNLVDLYFDRKGDLMLIEKNSQLQDFRGYQCKYSKSGKLIEAVFINNDEEIHYNSSKKIMYSIFSSHLGDSISKNSAKYVIE